MGWRDAPVVQKPGNAEKWRSAPIVGAAGARPAAPAGPATGNPFGGLDEQGRAVGAPGFDPVSATQGTPTTPDYVAPPPDPNQAQSDSLMEWLFNSAAFAADGAVTGISRLAGAPVDLMSSLVVNPISSALGGPTTDRPILGGEFLDDAAHGFDWAGPRVTPEDGAQRIIQRIGQEMGATALPVGAAMNVARRVGVQGARQLSNLLVRMFVEPAAVNPGAFLRKEMKVAGGAGLGAGLAGEVYDDPIADTAGALAGAGLTGASTVLASKLGDIVSALTGNPNFASRYVREGAADTLIQNSDILSRQIDPKNPSAPLDTQALVSALGKDVPLESLAPGFRAGSATRSGDFGLANLESARMRGDNGGLFRTRAQQNDAAVNEAVGAMAPGEQPGAFRTALEQQRNTVLSDAELAAVVAGQQADDVARPLTPRTTAPARGDILRNEIETAREAARQRTRDAYAAADINDVPVAPDALTGTLDDYTRSLTETERGLLPEGVIGRVARLGRAELDEAGEAMPLDPIRLKEAADLRSELGRLAAAAAADPRAERGGRNAARVLSGLAEQVDAFITQNVSPDQRRALGVARQTKIEEVDAFGRPGDPVAKSIERFDGGRPRMRDETVASTFTDTQNLDTLLSRVDTPALRAAIREEILSNADFTSTRRGQQFLAEYGDRLDRFPGLRDEVTAAITARGGAETARQNVSTLAADIGREGRGPVAKYLTYGNERARNAMSSVIADKDPAKAADTLLNFVGNEPRAVEGARRAYWDVMEAKSRGGGLASTAEDGAQPWLPRKWTAFLDDPANAAVADRLYRDNPEHLANIRELATALRSTATGRAASTALNPSGTGRMAANGTVSLAEAQSKIYAARRGQVSPIYVATYLAGKLANRLVSKQAEKAYQQLLDRALIDPDVATMLLREQNPANRAAMARAAKGYLAGHLAPAIDELFGDGEDPVVEAVTRGK